MRRWLAVLGVVGVGFYISGSILLGVVAGRWLDSMLNTRPVLVIAGLILGVIIAGYGVYQMFLPLIRNKRNKENG